MRIYSTLYQKLKSAVQMYNLLRYIWISYLYFLATPLKQVNNLDSRNITKLVIYF